MIGNRKKKPRTDHPLSGDDAAVKDLTMAILMSTNEGNINISANWDQV